jgi:hypothetical protein
VHRIAHRLVFFCVYIGKLILVFYLSCPSFSFLEHKNIAMMYKEAFVAKYFLKATLELLVLNDFENKIDSWMDHLVLQRN